MGGPGAGVRGAVPAVRRVEGFQPCKLQAGGNVTLQIESHSCMSYTIAGTWYTRFMRTLRVTVSDSEYEALRKAADTRQRSVQQLVQETLASFERATVEMRKPLRDLPVLSGHRPVEDLPARADLYEEMFSGEGSGSRP